MTPKTHIRIPRSHWTLASLSFSFLSFINFLLNGPRISSTLKYHILMRARMSMSLAQNPPVSGFTLEHSPLQCAPDDSWGPFTSCRFDFTLLFEQCILSGIPSAILLLASSVRIYQLRRQDQKIVKNHLGLYKLVRLWYVLEEWLSTDTTLGPCDYPRPISIDTAHLLGQKTLIT